MYSGSEFQMDEEAAGKAGSLQLLRVDYGPTARAVPMSKVFSLPLNV